MKKAKFTPECCDVCGKYVLPHEQLFITFEKSVSENVIDAFFIHEQCKSHVDGFINKMKSKFPCKTDIKRLDSVQSEMPRANIARALRKILSEKHFVQKCVRERLKEHLHGLQSIVCPVKGLAISRESHLKYQLDDAVNLQMLKKILSMNRMPKVIDQLSYLIVTDQNEYNSGAATLISVRVASLINDWGMQVVDGMILLQEQGYDAFAALEKMEELTDVTGLSASEAIEAIRSVQIKKTSRF